MRAESGERVAVYTPTFLVSVFSTLFAQSNQSGSRYRARSWKFDKQKWKKNNLHLDLLRLMIELFELLSKSSDVHILIMARDCHSCQN